MTPLKPVWAAAPLPGSQAAALRTAAVPQWIARIVASPLIGLFSAAAVVVLGLGLSRRRDVPASAPFPPGNKQRAGLQRQPRSRHRGIRLGLHLPVGELRQSDLRLGHARRLRVLLDDLPIGSDRLLRLPSLAVGP